MSSGTTHTRRATGEIASHMQRLLKAEFSRGGIFFKLINFRL